MRPPDAIGGPPPSGAARPPSGKATAAAADREDAAPATLIEAFEVAPDADAAFLAAWDAKREDRALVAPDLHRALLGDADLRFVAIARAGAAREAPGGRHFPFPSHVARYATVRAHGEVDIRGGVLRIDAAEVPDDGDAAYLAAWDRMHAALADRQGFVGARLHRSPARDAAFRFVTLARWSSPLMVARAAADAGVRAATPPFRSHAALYELVRP